MTTRNLIREIIDGWLKEHPSRSISHLVKLSGVSDSTIRRLKDGITSPTLDSIISLGRATGQNNLAKAAIEQYFPRCSSMVEKNEMLAEKQIQSDPSEFFETSFDTKLFMSIIARDEILKSDFKEQFGDYGLRLLDRVVSLGYANEDSPGHVTLSQKWFSWRSSDDVLRTLQHLATEFPIEDLGNPEATVGVLTKAVSQSTVERIRAVVDRALLEIQEAMREDSSTDGKVISVAMMMQPIK